MFYQLKLKAKEYANENSKKKSIKGLVFRRLKFYDMTFSFLLLFFLSSLGVSHPAKAGGNDPTIAKATYYQDILDAESVNAFVMSGGGNDPTMRAFVVENPTQMAEHINSYNTFADTIRTRFIKAALPIEDQESEDSNEDSTNSGGGHDPTCIYCPSIFGGGGHDPGKGRKPIKKPVKCGAVILEEGSKTPAQLRVICEAQSLLGEMVACESGDGEGCEVIEDELVERLSR